MSAPARTTHDPNSGELRPNRVKRLLKAGGTAFIAAGELNWTGDRCAHSAAGHSLRHAGVAQTSPAQGKCMAIVPPPPPLLTVSYTLRSSPPTHHTTHHTPHTTPHSTCPCQLTLITSSVSISLFYYHVPLHLAICVNISVFPNRPLRGTSGSNRDLQSNIWANCRHNLGQAL